MEYSDELVIDCSTGIVENMGPPSEKTIAQREAKVQSDKEYQEAVQRDLNTIKEAAKTDPVFAALVRVLRLA